VTDLDRLRATYSAEYPAYEALAKAVAEDIGTELQRRGIWASVEPPRAKAIPNTIRKVLKKLAKDGGDPEEILAAITDKAGVRVLVPHLGARRQVHHAIEAIFEVVKFEDMVERYGTDRLGYLGYHYEICRRDDPARLVCEVQLHTRASNAWSEFAHDLTYKPSGGQKVPKSLTRRLNMTVALIELFDKEANRIRKRILKLPGAEIARLLSVLEPEFLKLAYDDYDSEASTLVLSEVALAYSPGELAGYKQLVTEFMATHGERLAMVYEAYRNDPSASPLLFQPESIAVFERLVNKRMLLKAKWLQGGSFAPNVLYEFANVVGLPY
jgi:ppGpp synthetase/RelA/SpoT-type nucleotidyltranferase